MFKNLADTFTLSNGVNMPCVGYGTFRTPNGKECIEGVNFALELGYRHIDTAAYYANESGVGEGIRRSGIKRSDVFVTSKVWNDAQGYDKTMFAFDASLKALNLEQLDLYLIHWPSPEAHRDIFPKMYIDTWHALEKLYKDGQIRAIGVCNSLQHHLKALFGECEIKPMVNQVEYHLGYMQEDAVKFSQENGIMVEAWAPLCKGKAFGNEPLFSIAKAHGKKESQVLVRWCLQHNTLPLPKSVHFDRIKENADVFDFELSLDEMARLDKFSACGRFGSHPDEADF